MQFTAEIFISQDAGFSVKFRATTTEGEERSFNSEEAEVVAKQLLSFKQSVQERLQPRIVDFYFANDEAEGYSFLVMVLVMENTPQAREKIERLLDSVRGRELTDLALDAETQARIANLVRDTQL